MLLRRRSRASRILLAAIVMMAIEIPVHPTSAFAASVESNVVAFVPARGTAVISFPWKANLVAVSVPRGQRVPSLEARVGDQWIPFEFEADHGPSGAEAKRATPREFSGPIWIGTEREVRVRSLGAAVTARLHLINSLGDSSVAPAPLRVLGQMWRGLLVPRAAKAAVPNQRVISRAQWGADESWRSDGPGPADRLDAIFVHHTASGNNHGKSQVPAIVRGIYRYHTKTQGWSDLGYGFLIDRWGRVFEGRAGGITEPIVGAHARDHNTRSVGIAMIGTYDGSLPPYAARVALQRLVAWKADIHHMPIYGTTVLGDGGHRHNRVSGHRDANSTACPGKRLYSYLKSVRLGANRYGHPKLYLPYASRALRPDGDGANDVWRVGGWLSRSARWTVSIVDATGVKVFSATGTGTTFVDGTGAKIRWNGRSGGVLVPNGRYRWTISGRDANGEPFRPASGETLVVTSHPAGTLLADSRGTYWLKDGLVQSVSSLAARTTFAHRLVIPTGPDERARYSAGTPVAVRDGALLQDPSNARFVVSAGTRRLFSTPELFDTLGYDPAMVVEVTDLERDGIPLGAAISDASRHPSGTIVRRADPVTGRMQYWLLASLSRAPLSYLSVRSRVRHQEAVLATDGDMALPEGTRVGAMDGHLPRNNGNEWMLSGGTRREFVDADLFSLWGFTSAMLVWASPQDLDEFPVSGTLP